MEEYDDKFHVTQNDCPHTKFFPHVTCVTTTIKGLTQDVNEKSCPSNEKNTLIKVECNKWYNT